MDNYAAKIGDKYFLGGDNQGALARLYDYEATGLLPAEIVAMRGELEAAKTALNDMRFAYVNKDGDCPHQFETQALAAAERIIGAWGERDKVAPVAGILTTANFPLTLAEVLALPEGARVWVEERGDYIESKAHTRSGHHLLDDDGRHYDLFNKDWFLDGECERVDCRVWSLPVAPTEDEKAKYEWEVRDDG